jgi:hypothetical protein
MRERIVAGVFASLWKSLGGGEIRRGRAQAFWRGGKRDSVAVDTERGLWRDHATGEGGDAIDLIARALGCSIREALAWAEAEGYRTPSRRLSAAEIAEARRKREAAERHALHAADYLRALDAELDAGKLAAIDAGDDAALEGVASLQWRLAQAPAAVMAEMRQTDGARVRALIETGREDRQWCGRLVACVVDMLASAEVSHERAA